VINRFLMFLGPARARTLLFLLLITGAISLGLNTVTSSADVRSVQTLMVIVFIVGALIIIGGRLESSARSRFLAILLPAMGAVLIGVLALPTLLPFLMAGAIAWIVAGLFLFRSRIPMGYQRAIKLLRKSKFAEAIDEIDAVIKEEPNTPGHYRFRAELLRLSNKLDRARRDYQTMIELAPDAPDAYNGLSEVFLQMGKFNDARDAAVKASEIAAGDWVALYNLGMIEDRIGTLSLSVIEHLQNALNAKVPDERHRLLIYVYLARAYARLGELDQAQAQVDSVKRNRTGLQEWQKILESDQAVTLKAVIGADVEMAQALIDGSITVDDLMPGGGQPSLTTS